MFDISIGTLIPVREAAEMIPVLSPMGFECFELDFTGENPAEFDWDSLKSAIGSARISALGYYKNPILNENDRASLITLIKNARKLGCSVIGAFAGGNPELSVPDTIPAYKQVWEPIARLAEDEVVSIGFEGCGRGWDGGCKNIAFCSDAWELMFDAVPSKALGLEWEPCHALEKLADPVMQLRKWADRVVHVHGKDATIAVDLLAAHGMDSGVCYKWNRTPGFGDTNWADVFTILMQHGFRGSCDIEGYHDPVHYDDLEWSAQLTSLEYLKRCRGGITFFDGPSYKGYNKRFKQQ